MPPHLNHLPKGRGRKNRKISPRQGEDIIRVSLSFKGEKIIENPLSLEGEGRVRVKNYNQFSAPINNAVEWVKIML
jgi:hypothetical protein